MLHNLYNAGLQGKFIADEEELTERPKGALQDPKISLADPKKFFGIKGFGFTKANELFVGRLAQLGFAASLIGEGITGKGILGQIGLEVNPCPLSFYLPIAARAFVAGWCLKLCTYGLFDLDDVPRCDVKEPSPSLLW